MLKVGYLVSFGFSLVYDGYDGGYSSLELFKSFAFGHVGS